MLGFGLQLFFVFNPGFEGEKNGIYRYGLRSWHHGGSSCIFFVDAETADGQPLIN